MGKVLDGSKSFLFRRHGHTVPRSPRGRNALVLYANVSSTCGRSPTGGCICWRVPSRGSCSKSKSKSLSGSIRSRQSWDVGVAMWSTRRPRSRDAFRLSPWHSISIAIPISISMFGHRPKPCVVSSANACALRRAAARTRAARCSAIHVVLSDPLRRPSIRSTLPIVHRSRRYRLPVFAGRRGTDDRLTRTATIAVHDSSFIISMQNDRIEAFQPPAASLKQPPVPGWHASVHP